MSLGSRKRKWLAAAVLLALVLLASATSILVYLSNRASDGEWSTAIFLRIARSKWVEAGSPDDPSPYLKHLGWTAGGTNYVYATVQVVGGHTYRGLFAMRDKRLPRRTLAITKDGEVLILEDSGAIKLIEDSGRVRPLKP